eukprot:TRINITY_DN309_c0_g2_i1.p1 TRINITY_DN309_c0_g2~~TRINITY_DN309_c0_g2_i1.p1  ORF type:complete len:120 (-),score=63.39 TRINITY_DN309_c0_g2_i1:97-456(-)
MLVWGGADYKTLVISDIVTVSTVNLSGILNCIWFSYNEKLFQRYRSHFAGEDPWAGEMTNASGASMAPGSSTSSKSGHSDTSSREHDEFFEKPSKRRSDRASSGTKGAPQEARRARRRR